MEDINLVKLTELVQNSTVHRVGDFSFHRMFMASNKLFKAVQAGMKRTMFYGFVDVSSIDPVGTADKMVFKLADEIVLMCEDEYNDAKAPILFDRIEMVSSITNTSPVGTANNITTDSSVSNTLDVQFVNSTLNDVVIILDGTNYPLNMGLATPLPVKVDGTSVITINKTTSIKASYGLNRIDPATNDIAYSTIYNYGFANSIGDAAQYNYDIIEN